MGIVAAPSVLFMRMMNENDELDIPEGDLVTNG